MNFSDLELTLLLAMAVLLWRIRVLTKEYDDVVDQSNRYAQGLILVAKGEATVVTKPEGIYLVRKNHEEDHQTR